MTQQDAPDSKPYSFNSLLDISSFASTLKPKGMDDDGHLQINSRVKASLVKSRNIYSKLFSTKRA